MLICDQDFSCFLSSHLHSRLINTIINILTIILSIDNINSGNKLIYYPKSTYINNSGKYKSRNKLSMKFNSLGNIRAVKQSYTKNKMTLKLGGTHFESFI